MFPLNSVLFPGITVPLHVFEDRYRALVHHLRRVEDPTARLFGSVGIREGYEIGERGAQSLFRVGCRLQLTEIEENDDGTFEVLAVVRDRMRLEALEAGETFPTGVVELLEDGPETPSEEHLAEARGVFTAYRSALVAIGGPEVPDRLPQDPTYLSWAIAAATPLPMSARQEVLEAPDAVERLAILVRLLRGELRAMNVIPSLPATQLNRTGWSPN